MDCASAESYLDSYYKNAYKSLVLNRHLLNQPYMRKCPTADHYEYVAMYVETLCMITKDPQSLLNQPMALPYNFKLKGSRELAFHLGCSFNCNKLVSYA